MGSSSSAKMGEVEITTARAVTDAGIALSGEGATGEGTSGEGLALLEKTAHSVVAYVWTAAGRETSTVWVSTEKPLRSLGTRGAARTGGT